MRACRAMFAVFLALLFVYSTNRCVIAAAFPEKVEECCAGEKPGGESERGLPCGGQDCAPCATLENGVHPSSLMPLTITAPVWTEAEDLSELMRRLVIAAVEQGSVAPPDSAAMPPPLCLRLCRCAGLRWWVKAESVSDFGRYALRCAFARRGAALRHFTPTVTPVFA
jgi:hypothetical protein